MIQSKLNLDRLLSFWTHEVEYTLSGELKVGQLTVLIERCLNHWLPSSLFHDSTIKDLKGCGPQTLLLDDTLPPEYPEELIFLAGQYQPPYEPPDDTYSDPEENRPALEAVELKLLTEFDKFVGDNHISHRLITVHGASWPRELSWQEAPSAPGISLEHIRIGLEIFHDKLLGWSSMVAPVGDQRIFLEADARQFKILLGAQSLRSKTDIPLTKDGLLDRLSAVLNELFKFDIKSDYLKLMENS